MILFIFGIFIGAIVGMLFIAMCVMAKEDDTPEK